MRYGGARCVVVLGPVFVIFNIGFFAFYVRQTVKQLSWPGGGGYGSAAAVQGRNFLRHKQGSACC